MQTPQSCPAHRTFISESGPKPYALPRKGLDSSFQQVAWKAVERVGRVTGPESYGSRLPLGALLRGRKGRGSPGHRSPDSAQAGAGATWGTWKHLGVWGSGTAWSPSAQATEADRPQVQGYPELHN